MLKSYMKLHLKCLAYFLILGIVYCQPAAINNLNATIANSDINLNKTLSLIKISWLLDRNVVTNYCSVNYYTFKITNKYNSNTTTCSLAYNIDALDLYKTCARSNDQMKPTECSKVLYDKFAATNSNLATYFEVFLRLPLNSLFSLVLVPVSQTNGLTWPEQTISASFQTDISLPFSKLATESYSANDNIYITIPAIDQTKGKIANTYIILVKLADVNTNYDLINTIDQAYLKNLIDSSAFCSNQTQKRVTCILKIYGAGSINYEYETNVIISKDKTNIEETRTLKPISNSIIDTNSIYQTFVIFEIKNKNSVALKKRQIGPNSTNIVPSIYISSDPSKIIDLRKTQNNNNNNNNSNKSNENNTNTIIAVVVTLSIVIVVLIVVLIFVIVYLVKRNRKKKNNQIEKMKLTSLVDESKTEFEKSQIRQICKLKHKNNDEIFENEFKKLPEYNKSVYVKSTLASDKVENQIKNRYIDIKAYDESRVKLTNNNEQNDYINANFVQGYSSENKFIATQGPKKETIYDFWRMIDQYNVKIVIMLTNLVENNVIKCERYWPNNLNETEKYELYEVTYVEEQIFIDYIKRKLVLKNNFNNESKVVYQYYYPNWADKNTPSTDLISVFHLINDINFVNMNSNSTIPPIVVHCSAGVGRTGTYITLDAMMERINREGKMDIFKFVAKIRERRQHLVQTLNQYIFIHDALNEYCLYGITSLDIHTDNILRTLQDNLEKKIPDSDPSEKFLNIFNKTKSKTFIQLEFEKIINLNLNEINDSYYYSPSGFTPSTSSIFYLIPNYVQKFADAFTPENKTKNFNANSVCFDFNRVKIPALVVNKPRYSSKSRLSNESKGSSKRVSVQSLHNEYINACKLKFLKGLNKEFVVTQDPMPSTVVDFLRMVLELESNIVIALNKDLVTYTFFI